MRKVAYIITTQERYDRFIPKLLETAYVHNVFDGWFFGIVAQGYDKGTKAKLKANPYAGVLSEVVFLRDVLSPLDARAYAMRKWRAEEVYLALDDDMEFREETNFNAPLWLESVHRPGYGIVMGQSAKNDSILRRLKKKYEADKDRIDVEGALAYTYGGMMYSREVGDLLLQINEPNCACDNNAWALWLYTRGHLHYHYRGSLLIHKVGSLGGLRTFFHTERRLPYPEWIDWKKDTKRVLADRHESCRYQWPRKSDITEVAHELHRENRGQND